MAINPPAWCRGAVPTVRGWEDPNTGELLKSGKFTQEQVDAYLGIPTTAEVLIEAMPEPVADEEPTMSQLTKRELVELAEAQGVDVTGMTKPEIVATLESM
jgi:hypothetical protein